VITHWRRCLTLAVAAGAGALVAFAAAAQAGTTTRWERLTALDDGVTFQVGVARTGDGVLHSAWLRTEPGATRSLHHTAIARNGRFGATTPIQTGWTFMANPDLLASAGGLRVFFGGQRTTVTGDPNTEMNTATADISGAAWALQPFNAAQGAQAATDAGAAAPLDTPFVSWGATLGVFVHRGVDPATPNFDYQGALGGCCGYSPDLAVDGETGQLALAWYSNATGAVGVFAQGVDLGTGAPLGGFQRMPGVSNLQMISRTPITGRVREPGIYVAYPAGDRVLLWRMGASRVTTLARRSGTAHDIAGLAPDSQGRLWVFWSEKAGTRYRIVATRSNRTATRFGERVVMRPPRGSVDDFHLDGDAQRTRLDLFGSFGRIDGNSTWHRQVLPGLTLTARARRTRGGEVVVRARVADAGAPVGGATVTAGGARASTNAGGRATLRVRSRARRLVVVARASGYTPDRARVRVR
jgi:hypothetical protein